MRATSFWFLSLVRGNRVRHRSAIASLISIFELQAHSTQTMKAVSATTRFSLTALSYMVSGRLGEGRSGSLLPMGQ